MTSPQRLFSPEDAEIPEAQPAPRVDIVVPVRDEERDLAPSIRRLVTYLRTNFPFSTRVTIADNGSTDRTWAIATGLAQVLGEVRAVRLAEPGRGRTLRAEWSASDADVLAYMDVDLSTDLNALLPLVAPVLSGHSDVAIGTRLARGARVIRRPRREVISRCYNLLLHATLGTQFSDAQCGFKAISADKARVLLPLTHDTGWFFDTELLVLAQRAGLRIHEVPVDWVDDPDSRVRIIATALADLRGIVRVGWGLAWGTIRVPALDRPGLGAGPPATSGHGELPRQLVTFLAVGAVSTLGYLLLYLVLRTGLPAQPANAISLLVTAAGNPAANRRFTFGIQGRGRAAPVPGLAGVRRRAAAHLGRAGWAAPGQRQATAGGRGHRAAAGQSRCHRAPVPALPVLGVPGPAREPGPGQARHGDHAAAATGHRRPAGRI
jgi:hypothetical protein